MNIIKQQITLSACAINAVLLTDKWRLEHLSYLVKLDLWHNCRKRDTMVLSWKKREEAKIYDREPVSVAHIGLLYVVVGTHLHACIIDKAVECEEHFQ